MNLPYLAEISLVLLTILIATLLYKWQTGTVHFDLTEVLKGPDGKVSLFKMGQAAALVTSTWAFVVLVQRNQLTEYYFYGYMAVWSGVNLAKNIFAQKSQNNVAPVNDDTQVQYKVPKNKRIPADGLSSET